MTESIDKWEELEKMRQFVHETREEEIEFFLDNIKEADQFTLGHLKGSMTCLDVMLDYIRSRIKWDE